MSDIPTTVKNMQLVEKRREQIILAAINLFSQKGFHKTTLRELAQETGLSQGNIYDYVRSKEDIFFLLHEFLADHVDTLLSQSTENIRDPIEKLRRMVRAEYNMMDLWADAILLIYQEGHILSKPYMHKLLQREREHLKKFEHVIEDGVKKGVLRDCNVRLNANLIKSMVDAWVLKRWDLRGHASQLEAERAILELLFQGLTKEKDFASERHTDIHTLKGKSALVANGGTVLGTAILSFLLSKGVRLATHVHTFKKRRESPAIPPAESKTIKFYFGKEHGELSADLFKQIEKDFGPIDIYIQDLGIGNTEMMSANKDNLPSALRLEANLASAQNIAAFFQEKISKGTPGRVIYLAPWAWDKYASALRYETVKAGTVALTRSMAKTMARSRVNVNCVIPGFIKTIRPSKIQKEQAAELTDEIPFGYLGDISDVTDAVLFLAGDASKYVSGQALEITGGTA